MGPDELDDLLASIRDEGKRESALALYEGIRETDLVDEDVDERILKVLGLDGVYDIDYGTYISLLKERLAASRSFGKQLSTEEDELLVEEFRKVKGKVGRFKIRRKKITAENLGVTGPIKVSTERFYLTSKAVIPQPLLPDGEGSSEDIKDISEALDELLKSIIGQNVEAKKKAKESKKEDEQKRRVKREGELEKPIQKALGLVKKLVAPFQSILDRIMKFIQFTLIGFLVDKVLKWFADPANERKIKILGRFLKDWWPSLAFAAGLFLTPLGAFVRGTIKMLRGFIPQLIKFAAAHPILTGAALAGAGAYTVTQMNEQRRKEFKKTDPSIVLPEETAKTGKTPGIPQLQQEQVFQRGLSDAFSSGGKIRRRSFFGGEKIRKRSFFGGGEIDARDIGFEDGGGIAEDSGVKITGAGPDTQFIAAQPGEVMMSKKAVDKHGANFFLKLNKDAGGTNIPRMVNNIQLAQGGGLIKKPIKSFQGGGMIGGFGKALNLLGGMGLPGTGSVMSPRYTGMGYQNKFLGINLNRVNLPQIPGRQFSQPEVQRYNQSPSSPSTIRDWHPSEPVQVSIPKMRSSGTSVVGDAFKNFGRNVQTIKGAARRQEIMMRQMGYEPDGYVNLRGQPINLGPQSRAMPVGTPTVISRTQTIVLPPQTIASKKPSVPVKTGTQIPDVSTVARIPHREIVIQSLGIGDLMGV